MQRLVSYALYTLNTDGRETQFIGPSRVEVYSAQEVHDLLQHINARLRGPSFALATEVSEMITRALMMRGET